MSDYPPPQQVQLGENEDRIDEKSLPDLAFALINTGPTIACPLIHYPFSRTHTLGSTPHPSISSKRRRPGGGPPDTSPAKMQIEKVKANCKGCIFFH